VLHLTYTKSYWNDLCKNTLEREIHHNPTKGGKAEQVKFNSLYTGLHEIYFEKFGTNPPADIWHDNKTRFSDINFQRVNLSRYWLVKKPGLSPPSLLVQLIGLAISTLLIQASGGGFIFVFLTIGVIIAFVNRNNNKGKGGNNRTDGDGSGSFSCTSSEGHSGCSSHYGDSGCSSDGCSSGCSGCGGGCGGD
jgi:hypothetical protein